MANTFQIPKDGAIYTDMIYRRCRDFVSYGIWAGLELNALNKWISNFKTDEERYLCARMLDALIYRSGNQTLSLLKQLFSRVIPDLARSKGLSISLNDVERSFKSKVDPNARIVLVIPPNDPPTKSSHVIGRMLKRHLSFNSDWIIHPDKVQSQIGKVENFIFIDDFLGTGHQFSDFLADTGLKNDLDKTTCLYVTLAAHADGKDYLNTWHPKIHVGSVENLDDSHALFHDIAGSFPDEVNSCEAARDFYYDLLIDRNLQVYGSNRRGYGHFELVYAFEHAVPDNSLPVLWWKDSPSWFPLFRR